MNWGEELQHHPEYPQMADLAGMRASSPQTLHAVLTSEGMLNHAICEFRSWSNQLWNLMSADMQKSARTLIYFADSEWHIRLMLAFVQDVYHEVES